MVVDPALVLILVGSFMLLITLVGCCGALRNAPCLLKTVQSTVAVTAAALFSGSNVLMSLQFLGILVLVLLLQVTAGVLGYLFTDLVPSPPHGCHGNISAAKRRGLSPR